MTPQFAIPGMMPPDMPAREQQLPVRCDGSAKLQLCVKSEPCMPAVTARVFSLNNELRYSDAASTHVTRESQNVGGLTHYMFYVNFPPNTFTATPCKVYVRIDGGEERLFVSGPTGSARENFDVEEIES